MKDWKIIVRKVFLLPVYFYRVFISPLTPPACRFTPTCSQYMVEAVLKYGNLFEPEHIVSGAGIRFDGLFLVFDLVCAAR